LKRTMTKEEQFNTDNANEAATSQEKVKPENSAEISESLESTAENKISEVDRTSQEAIVATKHRLERAKTYYELPSEKTEEILTNGGFKEQITSTNDQITSLADSTKEKILNVAQIMRSGKEKIHAMYSAGQKESPEYQALSSVLMKKEGGKNTWKTENEVDVDTIKKILDTAESPKSELQSIATKERTLEKPELLSEKEASKKFLGDERKKLAEDIRRERKLQRDRLSALKTTAENAAISTENIESGQEDNRYGRILESQSTEANELAKRVSSSELSEQDAQDEEENISQLIASGENIKSLKAKLEEHYTKADAMAKERFDTLNRSLEHVMRRNNAFIVHKIVERDELRHNANSNVSGKTTYEDDVDILLALEPSVSASSATPGEKTKLWPGASGFLLGGGQIGEASSHDAGTHGEGIKKRGRENSSIEAIDDVVGRKDKGSRQQHEKDYERFGQNIMNEVVVNNPEVFGFFQNAEVDESGRFWAYDLDTREQSEKVGKEYGYRELLKGNVNNYRQRFSVANERGIPLFIMTEDRKVYECLGVNDDGTVEVGKQITPEEIAIGRAGLSAEKRKQLGERLLEKKIFKSQKTQEEARKIIGSL